MDSLLASVEPGQFDDAPAQRQHEQSIHREAGAYIDTYDFDEDEESQNEEDEDYDDEIDDGYDDNRIEDEDWEIAERGMCIPLKIDSMKLS